MAQESAYLKAQPERLQYAREVEQEARVKKDPLLLAEAWYLYGKTYAFVGNYHISQKYFLRSLSILEPRGDSFKLGRLYIRLSEIEAKQAHQREALFYAKLSLDLFHRIRSDKGLIRSYVVLGQIYDRNQDGKRTNYGRSLFYYKKVESLAFKLKDTLAMAEAAIQLGTLFAKNNDPQAIPYLNRALYLCKQIKKNLNTANALTQLVPAYINARQFELAYRTLIEAENFYAAKQLTEFDIRVAMERNYVLYFQALKQWNQAFLHLKKLNTLERSQLIADRNGAISRLSIEYETAKKEALLKAQKQEIELRNKALQNQQRFTMAIAALFIMAVIASIIFYKLSRKNQLTSHRNEELLKEQNHRVKNNLQVVSSLLNLQSKQLSDQAAKKAVEESRLRIESMALLHRKLYDGDKLAQVDLEEFICELVQGVLKSYGYDHIQPEFEINAGYLTADKAVPLGLVINELTTNACKYAFPDTVLPRLAIRCHRHKNKIELSVEDNGPGFDHSEIGRLVLVQDDRLLDTRKASFGMSLIQSQIVQLNGTSRFTSGSENQLSGTVFTMMFTV
jgi:two-component sensor histidine kinase